MLQLIQADPRFLVSAATLFGLVVGSFLNVAIYRLPRMSIRGWREQAAEIFTEWADEPGAPADIQLGRGRFDSMQEHLKTLASYTLVAPRSGCPSCGHRITAVENIPVLSWLVLRGRCSRCGQPISPRYPFVEALTALLSGYAAWRFGTGAAASWLALLSALAFVWTMIVLAFIDQESGYLPDNLTQPLLWLGILVSMRQTLGVDLSSSIVGAIAGYLFLWIIAKGWGLLRNVDAMGHGDFKLLAAIGAWLGWQNLPGVVLMSSFVGAVAGIGLMVTTGAGMQAKLRFGPYLAAAGVVLLFWGGEFNALLHFDELALELKTTFRDLF